MSIEQRSIRIGDHAHEITGDSGYLKHYGDNFEPLTMDIFSVLAEDNSRIIDVGANIGFTAIAFSHLSSAGRIAAIEPVPRTYELLSRNIAGSGMPNIATFNFAAGSETGEVVMQGHPDFLAGSFVADKFSIVDDLHFSDRVPVRRLDDAFPSLGLDRLDLMKVDTEGYELDVFDGARNLLNQYRPIVFLEMNHWCLSMFRRTSLPDFRDRLMEIFPVIYAVHGDEYLDFRDEKSAYRIAHEHMTKFHFANLVAGFDEDRITSALRSYREKRSIDGYVAPAEPTAVEFYAIAEKLNAVQQSLRVSDFRCSELESVIRKKDQQIWALEEKTRQ
jgi:FkbM family methyltransferase